MARGSGRKASGVKKPELQVGMNVATSTGINGRIMKVSKEPNTKYRNGKAIQTMETRVAIQKSNGEIVSFFGHLVQPI